MKDIQLKPGWKMVKFGEVVKNANLAERDPRANSVERIVGLEHIDPENLHIRRWDSIEQGTSFTRKFIPGQTLFGKRRAYQRKVAYAEFEGICSGDILTFEPKNKKSLLPELLPFICQCDAFFNHALGTSSGSLSPRTSWTALKDFEFSLPPLDEQKRIAEILWAADEASELFAQAYSHCENTQGALIDNLVTSKNSKWNYAPLRELIHGKPQYGANAPACEFKEHGLRYIRITDIDSNGILNRKEKAGVDLNNADAERFLLAPGDVLFARTGNTVGKFYLHSVQDNKCVYAGYLVRFRLDAKKIMPDYLFLFTRSKYYQKWIDNTVRTGAQPNINGQEYSSLPILVLPVDAQMQIVKKSKQIESVKEKIMDHILNIRIFTKTFMNGNEKMESSDF